MSYSQAQAIKQAVEDARHIVVLQADNPDGDSLASALALEQILSDLGKEVSLYCGVDIPTYLRYLEGWDRVHNELPQKFDLSIIVDTSTLTLLETLTKNNQVGWLRTRPCIVLDHHAVETNVPFASIVCNQVAVATGEVIYELAVSLSWPLGHQAQKLIATSILADSLGLVSEGTTARSIHIVAELVDRGVKLAELEDARRQMMRKSPALLKYKGLLLQRVEYFSDDRIAVISIPWQEIEKYSHEYNPTVLVLDDMRLTEGTDVAIGFKIYQDGKVTAKIRCNYGWMIAGDLAKFFGGGGHPYASGFKVTDGRTFEEVKKECIQVATRLLDTLGTASHD